MVKYCAVYGCLQNSRRNKKLRLFSFPSDELRCRYWLKPIGRKDLASKSINTLNRSYYVCELHFPESDFGKRYLKGDAVPTLQLPQFENSSSLSKYTQTDANLFSCPSSSKTLQRYPQKRVPTKRDPSPGYENNVDRVDDDDSMYECDVSPLKTEDNAEATVPGGSSHLHEGHLCDVCRGYIFGFRYACVECANFDLCAACEARGHHATHYVLRVPAGKLNLDVQAVIKRLRRELLQINNTEEVNIDENCIKVEVKEEYEEHVDPLEETGGSPAEPPQDSSSLDIPYEENEDSVPVSYLGMSEEGPQLVFEVPLTQPEQYPKVMPLQPAVFSHQSAVPEVPFQQSQVPHATATKTKPLMLAVQGLDTIRLLAGGRGSMGAAGGGAGQGASRGTDYKNTHRDDPRPSPQDEDAKPESRERTTIGRESRPPRKKRKK